MNLKAVITPVCFIINAIAVISCYALQEGKSSRQVDILYETKTFRSGSQNIDKSVDRFTVKNTWKLQLNKKNKFTLVMPWAKASLKSTLDGSTINGVEVGDSSVTTDITNTEGQTQRIVQDNQQETWVRFDADEETVRIQERPAPREESPNTSTSSGNGGSRTYGD